MNLENFAKNLAASVAALSALAYGVGYFILRARANALGANPGFKLLDQEYIFAGFKFVYVSLLILILIYPILLLTIKISAFIYRTLSNHRWLLNTTEFIALAALVACTLYLGFKLLSVSHLLLNLPADVNTGFAGAILGGNMHLRLAFIFTLFFVGATTLYWLAKRKRQAGWSAFSIKLMLIAALQIIMLPMAFGMFFTDRKIRVLDNQHPLSSKTGSILGIIDNTGEYLTLYGLNKQNQLALFTVELEKFIDIPITRVVSLKGFIDELLANQTLQSKQENSVDPTSEASTSSKNEKAAQTQASEDKAKKDKVVASKGSLLESFLKQLNIAFESIGSLGHSGVIQGELWGAKLDRQGNRTENTRIGSQNTLSWPVGLKPDEFIYALNGNQLLELKPADGKSRIIDKQHSWEKLLGVTEQETLLGIVRLKQKRQLVLATYTAKEGVKLLHNINSESHREEIHLLLGETRSYEGKRLLTTERLTRRSGIDVVLELPERKVVISDCSVKKCGQASLNVDGNWVLYIKE